MSLPETLNNLAVVAFKLHTLGREVLRQDKYDVAKALESRRGSKLR